jgi:hypothetical protein
MKKQYGIFEINRKAKYLLDGLDSITFLSERYLHDTEEEAINWFPSYDGHYVIMPVYVTTKEKEKDDILNLKIEFLESLRKSLFEIKLSNK